MIWNWKKEAVDQPAHFLVAFAAVAALELAGVQMSPLGGTIVGLFIAAPREHAQHGWKLFREGWSAVDGAFWVAGGMFGGWCFS